MPRTRRGSYHEQQEQQEPLELTPFRQKVNEWLQDVYADTDPKTGYIVKHPKGVYGQKIKGLIQHIYSQSPQVKLILGTRNIRANSLCIYIFHVFKFLSNYVLPPIAALMAAYLYYYSEVPQVVLEEAEDVTNTTETDSSWTIDPVEAGSWTGNGIRSFISVPFQFVTATIDRTFHVSEAMSSVHTTGTRLFYTPFVGIGVYIITHLLLHCFLNVQILLSKQWTLWNYQDLFLKETEQAIERAVVGIAKPQLIYFFEQYLTNSSKSTELVPYNRKTLEHIYHTYKDDVDLLRLTILERIFAQIRAISLGELLMYGRVSDTYLKGIHMLIRHADEELSTILFQLNQDINKFPQDVRQQLYATGSVAYQQMAQIANRLM